jgi:hypothetical protein
MRTERASEGKGLFISAAFYMTLSELHSLSLESSLPHTDSRVKLQFCKPASLTFLCDVSHMLVSTALNGQDTGQSHWSRDSISSNSYN